jgi:hypothetical protein
MSFTVIVNIMASTVAHARVANPFNTDGDFEDVGKNENRGNDELCRSEEEDEDCPCFPKSELERRLRSAGDPQNCTEYNSAEDLIRHMREVAHGIKNRKGL